MVTPLRALLVICSLTALTTTSGCVAYREKPLNLEAHLRAWRALNATDDSIKKRAEQLGRTYEPGDGLDREEATLLALVLNPQARVARLEAGATRAAAGLAGRWDDPELTTEVRHALDGSGSPWVVAASLSFTIPLSGRLAAERDRARAGISAARFAAIEVERGVAETLAEAWFAWSVAVEHGRLLTAYVETLEPLVSTARGLSAAGELSPERLGLLELEVAHHQLEAQAATAMMESRRERVLTLMGLTLEARVTLIPSVEAPAAPESAPASWPADHARVRFEAARYQQAEHTLRREVAKQYPELVLGPAFELGGGVPTLGFGLGLKLPSLNLNKFGIADATGRREVQRARTEGVVQWLLNRAARTRRQAARATSRQVALQALEQRIDQQLTRLVTLANQGELDVLVLTDVLKRGLSNRLAQLESQRLAALARVQLAHALRVEQPESQEAAQ